MFSILIPAFNEEKNISTTVERIKEVMRTVALKYEIIVVNDGSTDNTGNILKNIDGIKLIEHEKNKGYGASLKSGIKNAENDLILIIDSDNTYPAEKIPELLKYADKYNMIVGSRTSNNVNIPLYRRPAKWILSKLANYLSGIDIPDLNSGMRIFRKSDVSEFLKIISNGFSFTTTITLAYLCNGLTIKYVPIDYFKRKGKSKINPLKDGLNFIKIIIKTITYFNPLRVFLPISFLLFLSSIFISFYSILIEGKIMNTTIIVLFLASLQIALFGLIADLIVEKNR